MGRSHKGLTVIEQLAANEHAPNFIGAGADVVELGVAQQASGGEFIDITIAAER